MDIQLASQSPRRRELLAQIGVCFESVVPHVDEVPNIDEAPEDYVIRLAREKARAGFDMSPRLPTLGADTIVVCGDQILEKPYDQADAARMLSLLSGRCHRVMTAVSLYTPRSEQHRCVETYVHFREITREEMDNYWQSGEPRDKAGGYAIQGRGAVFVREIHGCYTNVVGLPLSATADMLKNFGISYWHPER